MLTVTLLPKGQGSNNGWNLLAGAATKWEACLTNDGDTSYSGVSWPTDGTQTFTMDSLPSDVVSITDVTVYIICRRNNNSLGNFRPGGIINGVYSQSGSQFSSSQAYATFSYSLGGGHTIDQVNAMEAGGDLTSNFWGSLCTQVYVIVTYVGSPPTVTTQNVLAIAPGTTATAYGNITNLGSTAVTAHGHVWDTLPNPTTALSTKTDNGAAATTGPFSSAMNNLKRGVTYYVRAYATNGEGTSYGGDVTFSYNSIRLDVKNLNLQYGDLDKTKELHVVLRNLSPTSKSSGTDGVVTIEIKYEPAS